MFIEQMKLYSKRVIKRFLFLPCRIGYEARWLEFTTIVQYLYDQTLYRKYWTNEKFIDSKEEKIKYLENNYGKPHK